VHRQAADPGRFSSRFPGLLAIDTCTVILRFVNLPDLSASDIKDSRRGARRNIANSLAGALLLRDRQQVLRVLRHPSFRRWALRDLPGLAYVAGNVGLRGLRYLFHRSGLAPRS
jgi:hypothetical protein